MARIGSPTLLEDFAAILKIGIKASGPNVHSQDGRTEHMVGTLYETATSML